MGNIRSAVGNIGHNIMDNLSSVLTTAKTQIENIIGGATTSLTNVWDGGFVGMSASGKDELKNNLENYCNRIQAIIDGFNHEGDISSAFKGDIEVAAKDFVAAIKELLQAYVSTMRQEISELEDAYNSFIAASSGVAQDVHDAAQDIRSNADSIRLD